MEISTTTEVTTYFEGDMLYSAMLQKIKRAQYEILLESYIFTSDTIGRKFIDALNEKASQNLAIRLHFDAVGSNYFQHGLSLRKKLDRRIEVKWFHRWNWRRPLQFNIRNHRKLLIVDTQVVFTGGFNIHQECSRARYGEKRWRDTHVMIESEIANLFVRYFDNLWFKKREAYLGPFGSIDLLPNITRKCRYLFRCRLTYLIKTAEKSILCTTPYFVPDEFILKALVTAAQRGVKVNLLVPYESDHPIVNVLAKQYYARLLQAGIQVNAYLPRMLHAKTLVVDNQTVIIGSANIDYRSFFINHELVCLFNSKRLAKELTEAFINDCKHALLISSKTRFKNTQHWWLWRPLAALLKHWI